MSKRKPPPPPPASTSEQIDRELAARALDKRKIGQTPTRAELRALKRYEKETEEARRRQYYATCPKKHYLELCGRSAKTVLQQADLYGLPLRGGEIDLGAALTAFHDLLAANHRKLNAVDGEDPMTGEASPMLERWREQKYELAKLDVQERKESLLPRAEIHDLNSRIAGIIRAVGDRLQRRCGPDAFEIFSEGLDDAQRFIDAYFAEKAQQQQAAEAAEGER